MLCSFASLFTRERERDAFELPLKTKHKLPSLSTRKYIHLLPIHISNSQTPNRLKVIKCAVRQVPVTFGH